MVNEEIRRYLQEHADVRYADFSSSLNPGCKPMLGVRIPVLRALAREVAKSDWRIFLDGAADDTFEETLLQGLVAGVAKMPYEEQMRRMADYARKITDWALCDCACVSFKFVRKHREEVWCFLQSYLASGEEYAQRFAVVMLLSHFVTDDFVERVLEACLGLRPAGYYSMMGVAWALSVCFVKYPDETCEVLADDRLDNTVRNKAIQKIRESYRVSADNKQRVYALKR